LEPFTRGAATWQLWSLPDENVAGENDDKIHLFFFFYLSSLKTIKRKVVIVEIRKASLSLKQRKFCEVFDGQDHEMSFL